MDRQRIYSNKRGQWNETDRLALSTLLIKCGYCVRVGKEAEEGKPKAMPKYFVEFWIE